MNVHHSKIDYMLKCRKKKLKYNPKTFKLKKCFWKQLLKIPLRLKNKLL